MTKREMLSARAVEILREHPDGMRIFDLVAALQVEQPQIPRATIRSSVWDLDRRLSDQVSKPARGHFRLTAHSA